jgi:hypothetical protein
MNHRPPKILLLVVGGVLAITSLHARSQSGQARKTAPTSPSLQELLTRHSAHPPVGEFGEVTTESPEARQRRLIRENLNKGLYRKRIEDPGSRVVNGQAESQNLTFIDSVRILKPGEHPDPPALPVSSTAIVIGTVTTAKAFVSEDRTFVYSDYQIHICEVLKPDPNRAIPIGDQITAWATGGSIHFPSGHIKHFIISGRGFPEIGTQYLFFLRRADSNVDAYAISTAFEIKDGVVHPLDDGQHAAQFDGMPATDFLNLVRAAISNVQAGGDQ